ncbi:MAG: TetR family transcriptional regulator [Halioglobus sp.]
MTAIASTAADANLDTRERLLHTALRLYASEGLHAVSLRRISAEAGSRNSAAMHYHFNNKLGVIEALMTMISREIERIALTLRQEQTPPCTLRSACRDILRPLVVLRRETEWGNDALRFVSRLVSETDADIAMMMNAIHAPFWHYLDAELTRALPALPAPVRRLRLMFIATNVVHGMAEVSWLTRSPFGDLSHFDEPSLLDHLVDYLIGGLEAASVSAR